MPTVGGSDGFDAEASAYQAEAAPTLREKRDFQAQTQTQEERKVSEKADEEHPLTGQWVDESHSWYDGSIIEITCSEGQGRWRPLKPKQKVHQKAHYTSKVISDSEWDLIETRDDGEERRFKLTAVLDDDGKTKGLQVQLIKADGALGDLKWHLVESTSGQGAQRRRLQDLVQSHAGHDVGPQFTFSCSGKAIRNNARVVVSHTAFDMLVGIVILANSILIGVEIDQSIDDSEPAQYIKVLEYFFLAFYVVELCLRYTAWGFKYFKDPWGCLDTCLVTIGISVLLLKDVLEGWLLKRIMIFRIIRLIRVLQPVRTFEILQPLWKLINGLTHAMGTLASTMLVIIFVLYIFACIGGEVVAQNERLVDLAMDPLTSKEGSAGFVVKEKFNSLSVIMLTLVQFTTADITEIYFPLIIEEPWLALYFGLAYLVITILLMNLVTAVLVEDAIARSSEDIKQKTKKTRRMLDQYIPQLEMVFDKVDHDGTGDINLTELAEFVPTDEMNLDYAVKDVMKPETLEECYECFDADNSGLVSKEEFIQGALAVLLKDAPQELTQLLQLVRASNKQLIAIQERLDAMEVRFS